MNVALLTARAAVDNINTIRTLSVDEEQARNSGSLGAPMPMTFVAYCLWQNFLCSDRKRPVMPIRNRFVFSIGHASVRLYWLLHVSRVKAGAISVFMDSIKLFKQLDTCCPDYPGQRWISAVKTNDRTGWGKLTSVGEAPA